MKEKGNINKNLIITIAIILIVVFAGYYYINRDRTDPTALLIGISAGDEIASVEGDLLSALGSLRTIRLDDSIFSNPVFRSLVNFSTVIPQQEWGRTNPFAPFGVGNSAPAQPAQQTQTQSTQTTGFDDDLNE